MHNFMIKIKQTEKAHWMGAKNRPTQVHSEQLQSKCERYALDSIQKVAYKINLNNFE